MAKKRTTKNNNKSEVSKTGNSQSETIENDDSDSNVGYFKILRKEIINELIFLIGEHYEEFFEFPDESVDAGVRIGELISEIHYLSGFNKESFCTSEYVDMPFDYRTVVMFMNFHENTEIVKWIPYGSSFMASIAWLYYSEKLIEIDITGDNLVHDYLTGFGFDADRFLSLDTDDVDEDKEYREMVIKKLELYEQYRLYL